MADATRLLCAALKRHIETGDRPRVPPYLGQLWEAFIALNSARQSHGYGPQPINLGEIEAWMRINRTPFQPHHIATLRAMDAVWMTKSRAGSQTTEATRDLTPAMFDAMFG